MRLNRFLAAAGVGSRRHCDELIAAGRVTINGKICTDFSAQPAARDHVKVNGKLVRVDSSLYLAINKPAGFVSTRSDPRARDTIFDLLPPKFPRLFNVGRLDAQSEGLLLLTNDGDLAQRLTHPRYKVEKEYEVTLDRLWDPALAPKLLRGIFLDGQRARILHLLQPGQRVCGSSYGRGSIDKFAACFEAWISRQTSCANSHRSLRLGDLPRGQWRALSKKRSSR